MAAQEIWNTTLLNDANLQGYYRHESGLLLHDATNKGKSLTMHGSVGEANGMFGKCADFGTGNTDKYFSIDDAFNITNQNAFSIACWAKLMEAQANEEQDVPFSFSNSGYGTFFVRIYKPTGNPSQVDLIRNNGLTQESDNWITDPGTTNWHHYALTVSTTTMRFYVDGADQGATTCSATPNGSTTRLSIGATVLGDSLFDGLIDEVLIFNKVLSGAEVTNIYSGGLTAYAHPSGGFFANA